MTQTVTDQNITIERQPSEARLQELGVYDWPTWSKEASEFPWHYDERETCYFRQGDVVVTPEGGSPVEMGQGDLVTFPQGMRCTWTIRQPVTKHFQLG
ncbi:MAG: cupin [Cyanobacteria bacterium QS_8_64_29]|nr:MAG: cupin [Cyanobacteria bacterium QS_8_64_29]